MSFNEQNLTEQQRLDLGALRSRIEDYVAKMSPGNLITEEQGAIEQKNLWFTIQTVLNRTGQDFVIQWTELLNLIRKHSKTEAGKPGAFHEKYSLRFFPHIALDSLERRKFQDVLVLLKHTANPTTRQLAIKQFNLQRLLRDFDQRIVDNIAAYYAV